MLEILCEQRVMLAAQQILASTKEVTQMKRRLVVLVFYSLFLSVMSRSTTMEPLLSQMQRMGDRNASYRQQSNRFNVSSLIKNAVKEIQRRACVEWDSESEQQINPETSADVRVLLSGTHHQEIPSPVGLFRRHRDPFKVQNTVPDQRNV